MHSRTTSIRWATVWSSFSLLLFFALVPMGRAQLGFISTVAGDGTATYSGDGGLAVNAGVAAPVYAAFDAAGDLYISASGRVRKVDKNTGIITTFAGDGGGAFSPDGIPATSASLRAPFGLAFDSAGNLFIAEQNAHRIRRVDGVTGLISTVAGNLIGIYGGDGGPATSAGVVSPAGIALDTAGNLYIGEGASNRIRRVDAVTGIITTVAGTGLAGFNGDGILATSADLNQPSDVTFDAAGNLIICETAGFRIRRVDAVTGIITTIAGNGIPGYSGDGGPATSARIRNSIGIAFDPAGNLFIVENAAHVIRRVDALTGIITTVAGNTSTGYNGDGIPATSASLTLPIGVRADSVGDIYFGDTANNRLRKVTLANPNQAPEITSVNGPLGPLALGTAPSVSAEFTDANSLDTHTCEFSWDDDNTTAGAVTEPTASSPGLCTASHTYAAPGVYTVGVTVTDDSGASDADVFQYVVIYDPNGGFVTGGGWINSPAGAYAPAPTLTGKASFGFVSKYQPGATIPTGQTEFQFKAGNLNFHSSTYQWLVVSGPKAQYKGTGAINGAGNYGFLLTATDGQVNGGGGIDKFRIKIWDVATGLVVYDNVPGGSEDIDAANPQVLGGGSIVIHAR